MMGGVQSCLFIYGNLVNLHCHMGLSKQASRRVRTMNALGLGKDTMAEAAHPINGYRSHLIEVAETLWVRLFVFIVGPRDLCRLP